jgi:hypothetical protein
MSAANMIIAARPTLIAAATLLENSGLPTADLTEAHMDHFFYSGFLSKKLI